MVKLAKRYTFGFQNSFCGSPLVENTDMADFSKELNDYLLKNNKSELISSNNIANSIASNVKTHVSNWLSRKTDSRQTATTNNLDDAKSDLCFLSLASFYIPFLILKARKFALLYTLGSLFFLMSFGMLWGP
uniref:Uncharacterized protein n=1 Tax=Strigamia maritima TaxID=126957 RepID=T1ITE4_STRMM